MRACQNHSGMMPCHMLPISTMSPPHVLSRVSPPKRPGAATNLTSHTFAFSVHMLLCTSQTSYVASWDLNPSSARSSDLPSNARLIVSSTTQLAISWSLVMSYSMRGAQNLTMSEQLSNTTMLKSPGDTTTTTPNSTMPPSSSSTSTSTPTPSAQPTPPANSQPAANTTTAPSACPRHTTHVLIRDDNPQYSMMSYDLKLHTTEHASIAQVNHEHTRKRCHTWTLLIGMRPVRTKCAPLTV